MCVNGFCDDYHISWRLILRVVRSYKERRGVYFTIACAVDVSSRSRIIDEVHLF